MCYNILVSEREETTMTATKNMIENRIAAIDEMGKAGELNGDLFMYAINERTFLTELAECEREDSARTVLLDNAVHKMAHEAVHYENKINKALRMTNKLVDAIENMKYDCDAEVYEKLLKIADVLAQ